MSEQIAVLIHALVVLLGVAVFVLAQYFTGWARGFGPVFLSVALRRRRTSARAIWRSYHDEWALRTEVLLFLKLALFLRAGLVAWLGVWIVLVVTGLEPFVERDIAPEMPQLAAKAAAFVIAGTVHLLWAKARAARAPEAQRLRAAPEEALIRLAITGV